MTKIYNICMSKHIKPVPLNHPNSPWTKMGISFKEWCDLEAQKLVNNLNRNVKIDHIDYVEHGVRPVDDDYFAFKKEFIELLGQDKYMQEALRREALVEEMYGTDWKSKRISIPDNPKIT